MNADISEPLPIEEAVERAIENAEEHSPAGGGCLTAQKQIIHEIACTEFQKIVDDEYWTFEEVGSLIEREINRQI